MPSSGCCCNKPSHGGGGSGGGSAGGKRDHHRGAVARSASLHLAPSLCHTRVQNGEQLARKAAGSQETPSPNATNTVRSRCSTGLVVVVDGQLATVGCNCTQRHGRTVQNTSAWCTYVRDQIELCTENGSFDDTFEDQIVLAHRLSCKSTQCQHVVIAAAYWPVEVSVDYEAYTLTLSSKHEY